MKERFNLLKGVSGNRLNQRNEEIDEGPGGDYCGRVNRGSDWLLWQHARRLRYNWKPLVGGSYRDTYWADTYTQLQA